ncbi:MAG TPA: hypothetical protein VMV86_00110 [Methanosarcinales archaeon]|nr:hypothetical protein [Methanosarcinales archaeon]
MSDKPKALPDILPDIKFNLKAQEQFAKDKGVIFIHWAAIPSPIGLKDRGDYRRPDSLDTISENGFLYEKVGEFTGTIIGNNHSNQYGAAEGGIYDNSTARIVIPKFYNDKKPSNKKEISLLPGDRIYAKGIEIKVDNYQKAEYTPENTDVLQFPALCVSQLTDSSNKKYIQGRHFKVSKAGNIQWIPGKENPGIDLETGKGRIYGIRYTYLAFWYIQSLINEVRITNTNTSEEPARLPYHAVIQREYVYHNKNRGDAKDTNVKKSHTERTNEKPTESTEPNQPQVRVDLKNFE